MRARLSRTCSRASRSSSAAAAVEEPTSHSAAMPATDRQADPYRRNRLTGGLVVIDEASHETVAAGVILDTEVETRDGGASRTKTERSPNVKWQRTRMTRGRRW